MEYETLKTRLLKYQKNKKEQVIAPTPTIKNQNKIPNKYGQATDYLLYYMTMSAPVIDKAESKVSMIIDDKGYRAEYEACEELNQFANSLIKEPEMTIYEKFNQLDIDSRLNLLNM